MRTIIIYHSETMNIKGLFMKNALSNVCEKVLLAEGLGLRVFYCKPCEVVELEIGAISLRLSPQSIQRIANLMTKASLQLDRIEHVAKNATSPSEPQLIH
jgi:hypothetical protein